MAGGNVCTHNEFEGLYYLDREFIDVYQKAVRCEYGHPCEYDDEEPMSTARMLRDDSEWVFDYVGTQVMWDDMVDYMTGSLMRRFPSFYKVDIWRGRDSRHILLENKLFQIAVVDNEWSVAWCLLERPDADDTGSNWPLMKRHYQSYLDGIREALLDGYGEAIAYGGAWVSGEVYRRKM